MAKGGCGGRIRTCDLQVMSLTKMGPKLLNSKDFLKIMCHLCAIHGSASI